MSLGDAADKAKQELLDGFELLCQGEELLDPAKHPWVQAVADAAIKLDSLYMEREPKSDSIIWLRKVMAQRIIEEVDTEKGTLYKEHPKERAEWRTFFEEHLPDYLAWAEDRRSLVAKAREAREIHKNDKEADKWWSKVRALDADLRQKTGIDAKA